MKKIVVKFGGSNLKRKEDILRLVEIIKAYDRPLVIVVSAFFGITNKLTKSLSEIKTDESQIKDLIHSIEQLKLDTINENFTDKPLAEKTFTKIKSRINDLERYLKGVHYIGDVPSFVEDVVLSFGERLSSLMLASILQSHNINAQEMLPEDLGLITDGEYGNASVNYSKSKASVSEKLNEDKIYVVPGFYGVSEAGKVTLLGRGGSDYSAASIANCVGAESLDVWKDVNGFMTSDPKLVSKAKRIKELSYTEAAELSYFGAGILHPRTVEPLRKIGIPIRVLNVDDFSGKIDPRTIINDRDIVSEQIIKSVTYSNDFCILILRGAGVGMKKGVLAKVTNELDRADINIKSVVTSQIAINLLLSEADAGKAEQLIKNLELPTLTEITILNKLSTVAIVGEGTLDKAGIAGRMFMALAREQINIRMIASGASPVATYCILLDKDKDQAVQAIHKEFFS